MPVQPRPLTVCVDDFGLHDGVNRAVFDLVGRGRVSAVSCLVDGVAWASGAAALQAVVGQGAERRADVGLHLNFSEALQPASLTGSAWVAQPVSTLIVRSLSRQLDGQVLRAEVERQWARFEAVWGRPPDFVDGHQHVHQLPQIRDALMAVLDARQASLPAHFWLRDCGTSVLQQWCAGVPVPVAVKAGVISVLGSAALRRLARQRGLRTSTGLLGSYPFDTDEAGYLALWRAWLGLVPARGGLLMCHPSLGAVAPAVPDPIAAARAVEQSALQGAALGALTEAAGVRITRLGVGD